MMTAMGHMRSFGIYFQVEVKENGRSPSVTLLCAGILQRGMMSAGANDAGV